MALDIYELHRNLYKNCSFFVTVEQLSTSKISSTCPTGVNYYIKICGRLERKKVMKFEREIPIGLDARRKKTTGGAKMAPPPPNGIRVKP